MCSACEIACDSGTPVVKKAGRAGFWSQFVSGKISFMTRKKEKVSNSRQVVGQAVAQSTGVDMSGCSC